MLQLFPTCQLNCQGIWNFCSGKYLWLESDGIAMSNLRESFEAIVTKRDGVSLRNNFSVFHKVEVRIAYVLLYPNLLLWDFTGFVVVFVRPRKDLGIITS